MKQLLSRVALVTVSTGVLASQTYAAGLADLAAGVDQTDIIAGMTAVSLIVAGVLAARMGIRKVLSMIK